MIAVIADDLTGAAELGGLGLRFKLKVEIATEVFADSSADLLIISADTRSVSEKEATAKIKKITKELINLQPKHFYKKIDSVLRGHVVAELKAQMEEMKLSRALVIPANPLLDRTIKDGKYYFKGELIHLSSFSRDPEFPILSSSVVEMLRANGEVSVIKTGEALPQSGIAVGEVEQSEDLRLWANKIDKNTLLAGAAGFFNAVLQKMLVRGNGFLEDESRLQEPMLFVCGTTFKNSQDAIRKLKERGGPVSYMPAGLVEAENASTLDYEEWTREIVELLKAYGKAIIAIDETTTGSATANDLREKTASVVDRILNKIQIGELIVEGGSTAAAIINKQNFTQLIPVKELSPGVIRMKVKCKENLHITIKPGSYDWSPEVWKF